MSTTIPGHSRHNWRIQINQSGAWASMFRFQSDSPTFTREVLAAAQELALLDCASKATMRLVNKDGQEMATWTAATGWTWEALNA